MTDDFIYVSFLEPEINMIIRSLEDDLKYYPEGSFTYEMMESLRQRFINSISRKKEEQKQH